MKLKLANPLKIIEINQRFGQNATDVYRRVGMKGHSGLDLYATHGTPIYACHDGYAQYQIGADRGHGVVVISKDQYEHEFGTSLVKTVYWHMVDFTREPQYKSPIADKTGFVEVKTGDLLGYADNTGTSTGTHLHLELKPVQGSFGFWTNIYQNNGYFGGIDPLPYLPIMPKPFIRIMRRGDEGQDIVKLQSFFLRTGYMKPILRGFGVYGPATQAAVKQFQIDNGIKHNNGVQVGPLTIAKLNERYDL